MWGDQLRQNPGQEIPRENLTYLPEIIQGRKVFIAPESEAYSVWRLDRKNLMRCPKNFYTRRRSMFHQKNSILTPPIDYQYVKHTLTMHIFCLTYFICTLRIVS